MKLAKTYWPSGDAVNVFDFTTTEKNPWIEIVGIVQDVRHDLNTITDFCHTRRIPGMVAWWQGHGRSCQYVVGSSTAGLGN
jgi:hypothetical protein